jgi:hypothetical protein
MLGLGEGQTILDRYYYFCYHYMSVSNCSLYRWQGPDDEYRYEWFIPVDAFKKSHGIRPQHAVVARSATYPTQGGLERLHHEALSSILSNGSELQQIQGRDSSGITIWTCTS